MKYIKKLNIDFNDWDYYKKVPSIGKIKIENFIGETFYKIDSDEYELKFYSNSGRIYIMNHQQDCCENVYIEDINGDLNDLIDTPILKASQETSHDVENIILPNNKQESYTWTFYKFATIKGYVTIRWFGTSNGYYSEEVNINRIK